MLASLIRLRQSQSANKDSNCDQGDMREVEITLSTEEILSVFFPPSFTKHTNCNRIWKHLHTVYAGKCLYTHTHTHKTGHLNQTALSHTVTVATVAGSMQNALCHVSGVIFCLHPTHTPARAHTKPSFSCSNSCTDLSSGSLSKALQVWVLQVTGQIFIL